MSNADIIDEIKIEIENLSSVVIELMMLLKESEVRELSVRDKTAAGSFLSQFYNGVENILKRICRLRKIELPKDELWHLKLFKMYCKPAQKSLPLLFDESLENDFSSYRRFRHIVHHGYGFQLKWEIMKEGIEKVEGVFQSFRKNIETFINNL